VTLRLGYSSHAGFEMLPLLSPLLLLLLKLAFPLLVQKICAACVFQSMLQIIAYP